MTSVELVIEDARAKQEPELPGGLQAIGAAIHRNNTPSFTAIDALLEHDAEVKPGQFLGVWHGRRGLNILTIIQVTNAFEVNPNEAPDLAAAREVLGLGRGYAGEGISTRIYRLAESRTVEEFDIREDNGQIVTMNARAPVQLARAGDPVVLLPEHIAVQTIGGKTNPADGVMLGVTYGSTSVPVILNPLLFQLHTLIVGNPSKGKSYLMGNLIEEANEWGIPCLILDINGELVAAVTALGGLVITLPDQKRFGLSLNLMTPQELVAVTPNVQSGTQYAELIELAHGRLREEKAGRITFDDLRHKIAELGEVMKTAKTSIGAAIARISALEHDPIIGGNFDFIDSLRRYGIVLLDCRFLSLRQTQLIGAMGARELQRIGREMARKAEAGDQEAARWFAVYFVDEAHVVVPDDDHVVSTQVHFELARMGRHVRTGLVLSSQSPQDLHKSVLKRLQTRFVFALEKDQLRAIEGVLVDLDEAIVKQLPKLPRGICAVSGSGDVVRHGFLLEVRQRVTPVRGSTPDVFTHRKKTPAR